MPRKGEGPVLDWLRNVAFNYRGDDCLVGPASTIPNGYAQAWWNGAKTYVHSIVCEHFHGPRPSPEHEAAHSCNNRACGNGAHLSWKTHAANMDDQKVHGTIARGNDMPHAVLTPEKVKQIRASRQTGKFLAKVYGVSPATISLVRNRKVWAHIE